MGTDKVKDDNNSKDTPPILPFMEVPKLVPERLTIDFELEVDPDDPTNPDKVRVKEARVSVYKEPEPSLRIPADKDGNYDPAGDHRFIKRSLAEKYAAKE